MVWRQPQAENSGAGSPVFVFRENLRQLKEIDS